MIRTLLFIAFGLSGGWIYCQNICDESSTLLETGVQFHLAIKSSSGKVSYIDGKTCSKSLSLRSTTVGYSGTTWELFKYPGTTNIYAIKSLGGCNTKWLDGKTCSQSLTLRDENYSTNTGLGGTRWKIHNLGNGRYAFEALGGCSTKWLCIKNNQFLLRDNFTTYGDKWMIDIYTKKTVFESGKEGYHTFRIPSIITTKNGTLIAFCEGRKNSSSDTGNIDLVMKKSNDNGLSWSSLKIIWSDGDNTCGNPTAIVDINNRVWLFMTHNHGADFQSEIEDYSAWGGRSIWYVYSDDEGASWSNPQNVTPYVQIPETKWDATGPGIGIEKKDGTLMIPGVDRIISSFDGGNTWCTSPQRLGSSESQIIELENGGILRNRRHSGYYRKVNSSIDNGITWNQETSDSVLLSPKGGCQGSIFRYSFLNEGTNRILFSNPADTTSLPNNTKRSVRQKMTVRLSYDEGGKWIYSKEIWGKFSAYSCLTRLCNNSIGLLYEEGDAKNTNNDYERIVFQNFTLDWLTDWNDPIISSTSLEPLLNDRNIRVYPNPVNSILFIEFDDNWPKTKLDFEIVNSLGQSVNKDNLNPNGSNKQQIDVSYLVEGLYFILIKTKNKVYTNPFIK